MSYRPSRKTVVFVFGGFSVLLLLAGCDGDLALRGSDGGSTLDAKAGDATERDQAVDASVEGGVEPLPDTGGSDIGQLDGGAELDMAVDTSFDAGIEPDSTDACSASPCQNGGSCSVTPEGFTCDCSLSGATGDRCQQPNLADDCVPSPCLNGGVCTDTGIFSHTCDCTGTEATGDNCELYCTTARMNGTPYANSGDSPAPNGSTIPFEICSHQQLDNVRNNLSSNFVLKGDLDLAGLDWIPIGATTTTAARFSGTFDGENHTIRNLVVDRYHTGSISEYHLAHAGLFARLSGTIKNLKLENPQVTGNYYAGTIVAEIRRGTLSYVSAMGGSVDAPAHTGGLVGLNMSGIIEYSSSSTEVKAVLGSGLRGGLAGESIQDRQSVPHGEPSIIRSCYSTSRVSGRYRSGGLVGENDDFIEDSFYAGTVTIPDTQGSCEGIGGFVGSDRGDSDNHIRNSYVLAEVVNLSQSDCSNVGHFIGHGFSSPEIENCFVATPQPGGKFVGAYYMPMFSQSHLRNNHYNGYVVNDANGSVSTTTLAPPTSTSHAVFSGTRAWSFSAGSGTWKDNFPNAYPTHMFSRVRPPAVPSSLGGPADPLRNCTPISNEMRFFGHGGALTGGQLNMTFLITWTSDGTTVTPTRRAVLTGAQQLFFDVCVTRELTIAIDPGSLPPGCSSAYFANNAFNAYQILPSQTELYYRSDSPVSTSGVVHVHCN